MRYKGLLFDKDGTLLEFHQFWGKVATAVCSDILAYSSRNAGNRHTAAAELLKSIGVMDDRIDSHGLLASDPVEKTAEEWFRLLEPAVTPEAFTHEVKKAFNTQVRKNSRWIQALPGITEALGRFRAQGFVLGIATADTKDATLFSLEKAGLLHFFDYIGFSDGDIDPKPAPALLSAFCEECQLRPDEVIMFGDTVSDMQFGRHGGAGTVGVLTGSAEAAAIRPYADRLCASVAEFDVSDMPG